MPIFDKHTLAGFKGAGLGLVHGSLEAAKGLTGGLSEKLLDKLSPRYREVESQLAEEMNLEFDTTASKGLEFLGEMALIGKVAGGATKLAGLSEMAKSSKLLPRLATRITAGAGTGSGLESLKYLAGNSTPKEIAKEAAIWGAIEGTFGLVGMGVGKGISKLAEQSKVLYKEINMPKTLHGIKNKLKMPEKQFREIIKEYTGGRTISTKELSHSEFVEISNGLMHELRIRGNISAIHTTMNDMANSIGKGLAKTGTTIVDNEALTFGKKIKDISRKATNKLVYKPLIRFDRLLERADRYVKGIHTETYNEIAKGQSFAKDAIRVEEENLVGVISKTGLNMKDIMKKVRYKSNPELFFTPEQAMTSYMGNKEATKHTLKHLTKSHGRKGEQIGEMINYIENNKSLKNIADYMASRYDTVGSQSLNVLKNTTGKTVDKIPGWLPVRIKSVNGVKQPTSFIDELFGNLGKASTTRISMHKARGEAVGEIFENSVENFVHNMTKMHNFNNMADSLNKGSILFNNSTWQKGIKDRFGEDYLRAIMDNFQSIKDPTFNMTNDIISSPLRMLRKNATTYALGFNLGTVMKQPISLINGMSEIGLKNGLASMTNFMHNPAKMKKFIVNVESKSKMMKNRSAFRDIEENLASGKIGKTLRNKLDKKAFWMIKKADKATSSIVWDGAYNKFINKNSKQLHKFKDGLLESKAIEYADQIVRRTQPMASMVDLPLLFKGGEVSKLFTMFSNQLNQNFNSLVHDTIGKGLAGSISKKEAIYKAFMLTVIPGTVMSAVASGGETINKAINKDDPNDLALDVSMYPISSIAILGDIINSSVRGFDAGLPMPLQTLQKGGKVITSKTPEGKLRNLADFSARIAGVPFVQPKRTYYGIKDLQSGKTTDARRLIFSEYALSGETGKRNKKGQLKGLKGLGGLKGVRGLNKVSV